MVPLKVLPWWSPKPNSEKCMFFSPDLSLVLVGIKMAKGPRPIRRQRERAVKRAAQSQGCLNGAYRAAQSQGCVRGRQQGAQSQGSAEGAANHRAPDVCVNRGQRPFGGKYYFLMGEWYNLGSRPGYGGGGGDSMTHIKPSNNHTFLVFLFYKFLKRESI